MSKEKNFERVDTSGLPDKNAEKEPGLPVKIPLSIVRWLAYSFAFMLLLVPWGSGMPHDGPKVACGGMVLGWFASLLNAIANKK